MAAVTHLGATATTTGTGPYVSGSFSPAANDLLVVYVVCSDTANAAPTLVESAGGGTYTLVGRAFYRTTLDSIYVFVRNTLCEDAVARTWTFTLPSDPGTGCVISIAKVTGVPRAGLAAIRQFDTTDNQAGAGTPNTVFAGVALTGNPCIFGVGNNTNPATQTQPASFSERLDTGWATPTTGFQYSSRDSGHTSATITQGGTSASTWGAFAVEIDASPPVPDLLNMAPMMR